MIAYQAIMIIKNCLDGKRRAYEHIIIPPQITEKTESEESKSLQFRKNFWDMIKKNPEEFERIVKFFDSFADVKPVLDQSTIDFLRKRDITAIQNLHVMLNDEKRNPHSLFSLLPLDINNLVKSIVKKGTFTLSPEEVEKVYNESTIKPKHP